MNKDKNIQKELEDLSPFLAEMKGKREDIEMPENYFHYLENSVMQQVQLENAPVFQTKEVVSLWSRLFSPRGVMGLASVVLLIVAGVYFSQTETGIDTPSNPLQFADLTDTEILNYLTDNAEVLDIYSLSELDEDSSILDMIDLEEGDIDFLLEENSADTFSEELF